MTPPKKPPIVVEDFDVFDGVIPPRPKDYQELVAEMVARRLLDIFGWSTLGSLVGGTVVILALFRFYSAQDAETLVDKALVPYLRGVATFATTVFGPLLAFILGFYFGKGNQAESKSKR